MEEIFMHNENSKTNEPQKFRLRLDDKLNLRDPSKNRALADLSIYYIWWNIKSAYNNDKFKISAPTWNDKFDFLVASYCTLDIHDSFEFIIINMKPMWTLCEQD